MSDNLKKISAKEARENFATIINEIAFGNKHYTVTRYDKDVIVMLPAEEWKAIEKILRRLEDEEDIAAADEAHELYMKEGGVSFEEFKKEIGR